MLKKSASLPKDPLTLVCSEIEWACSEIDAVEGVEQLLSSMGLRAPGPRVPQSTSLPISYSPRAIEEAGRETPGCWVFRSRFGCSIEIKAFITADIAAGSCIAIVGLHDQLQRKRPCLQTQPRDTRARCSRSKERCVPSPCGIMKGFDPPWTKV